MKDTCIHCGEVVNITHSPNHNEGDFISDINKDVLEVFKGTIPYDDIIYTEGYKARRIRITICTTCIEKFTT